VAGGCAHGAAPSIGGGSDGLRGLPAAPPRVKVGTRRCVRSSGRPLRAGETVFGESGIGGSSRGDRGAALAADADDKGVCDSFELASEGLSVGASLEVESVKITGGAGGPAMRIGVPDVFSNG
jgi:hypothetical protein